ncbi:MAG: porin family protein [Alphaproteobacteria bacterium]|nr:porin family protein [Alphaproteobacteria bacterium]
MRKIITLLLAALMLCQTGAAKAEYYVSAGVGYTHNTGSANRAGIRADIDDSMLYSLAAGYQLPMLDLVRLEAEYVHNHADLQAKIGNMNMDALMANGYVRIPVPLLLLEPYAGLGLGIMRLNQEMGMMYQGILGIEADIFTLPLVADVEYRYSQANRAVEHQGKTLKYYAHTLMLKLRWLF